MQPPAEGDPRQIHEQSDLLKCTLPLSLEFSIINSNTLVHHQVRWDIVINLKGNRNFYVLTSKILKHMVFACISAKLNASEGSPRSSPHENQLTS